MNEDIKKIIKLSNENPDLEIKFMVDYEVVGGDDFRYWAGLLHNIEKDEYFFDDEHGDEKIYIGKEQINKKIRDGVDCFHLEDEYKRFKEEGKIAEAIFVYIKP